MSISAKRPAVCSPGQQHRVGVADHGEVQQVGIIGARDGQARVADRHRAGRSSELPLSLFRTISSVSIPDDTIRFSVANAAILIGVPPARQPRKDAAANRERVLDAATELVRREGEKVPMADIARHAGVGVGTVYRHFATREELLGALVHRSFGLAVDQRARGRRRTRVRARRRPRVPPRHAARPRPLRPSAARRPGASSTPPSAQLQAEVRVALQGLIDRGQAAGELRADLTPEDLIVSASLLSRPLAAVDDWELPRRPADRAPPERPSPHYLTLYLRL